MARHAGGVLRPRSDIARLLRRPGGRSWRTTRPGHGRRSEGVDATVHDAVLLATRAQTRPSPDCGGFSRTRTRDVRAGRPVHAAHMTRAVGPELDPRAADLADGPCCRR